MGCGGKERSIKSRPVTGHAFGRRILLIVFASLLFFTVLVNALVIRVLQQGWEATLLQQQQEMSEMVTRRLDNALDSRRQTLERLTVQLHDGGWFNLRASNTEPLLRCNVEATDEQDLVRLRDEVLALLEG